MFIFIPLPSVVWAVEGEAVVLDFVGETCFQVLHFHMKPWGESSESYNCSLADAWAGTPSVGCATGSPTSPYSLLLLDIGMIQLGGDDGCESTDTGAGARLREIKMEAEEFREIRLDLVAL